MFRAAMNNQVEVMVLIRAQRLAHTARLIWVIRNVDLPAIRTKQMSYPLPSPMQVVMMMLASRCTCRRLSAIYEGFRRQRHVDGKDIRRKRGADGPIRSFYLGRKARAFRGSSWSKLTKPVATMWLVVINLCESLTRCTALMLVSKHE